MTSSLEQAPQLPELEFRYVSMNDPLAEFMLQDLQEEYDRLYEGQRLSAVEDKETNKYPASVFSEADGGAFVLLLSKGKAVAGGAIMKPHDALAPEYAAEFKRIWSHPEYRRKGLGKFLMQELEFEAVRLGYNSVYLTTGNEQPKAIALYQRLGYEHRPIVEDNGHVFHAFTKSLAAQRAALQTNPRERGLIG